MAPAQVTAVASAAALAQVASELASVSASAWGSAAQALASEWVEAQARVTAVRGMVEEQEPAPAALSAPRPG